MQLLQLTEPEAAQGLGWEEKGKCLTAWDQLPERKEAPLRTRARASDVSRRVLKQHFVNICRRGLLTTLPSN